MKFLAGVRLVNPNCGRITAFAVKLILNPMVIDAMLSTNEPTFV